MDFTVRKQDICNACQRAVMKNRYCQIGFHCLFNNVYFYPVS